ncbi:MAG TPA: GntR family transcriptional regulator [Vicinamibacterales bacterium]|nr:GntR family transcriptional regulator [Vicinamibacterales bacterium]
MIPLTSRVNSLLDLDPGVSPPAALPDRLYAILKHRILTCAMRPGERIVEKTICAEMTISRTPLREAINRLALEGLVVLTPYRGYAVAPVTVRSFQELCEVRRIVEPDTAALAATRASTEQLAALRAEAELKYTPGQPETYERYLRANSRFHRALARCADNSLLEVVVTSALDRHQRPLYLGLDVGLDAQAATTEHLALVQALENHDAKQARALMFDHVSHAEARIVAALSAAGYQ